MTVDASGGPAVTGGQPSHFERIGGAAAIGAAVDQLYQRILADPALAPYFTGVDLPGLKRHMALLLTTVLGGPDEYQGRGLVEAHQGRGITEQDYQRVGAHLTSVLTDLGVDRAAIDAVTGVLLDVSDQVIGARGTA